MLNDNFDIDMIAFASALERRSIDRTLAGLIRKASSRRSATIDLELARRRLNLLIDFPYQAAPLPRLQDDDEGALIGCIFDSALLLYCRATDTSSKHRKRVPIADEYSSERRIKHRGLMKVRNDAMAHFGYGQDLRDGPWAEDRPIFKRRHGVTSQIFRFRRVNYRANLVNDLHEMIDCALDISIKLRDEAVDRCDLQMETFISDPKQLDFFLSFATKPTEDDLPEFQTIIQPSLDRTFSG